MKGDEREDRVINSVSFKWVTKDKKLELGFQHMGYSPYHFFKHSIVNECSLYLKKLYCIEKC
jgi:hypothetical protein